MNAEVRERLEGSGFTIVEGEPLALFHAGPIERLKQIEEDLVVPPTDELLGRRFAYLASSPAIAETLARAEGVVEVEVAFATRLELGLGDDPAKVWVELVAEGDDGIKVISAERVETYEETASEETP